LFYIYIVHVVVMFHRAKNSTILVLLDLPITISTSLV